MVLVSLQAVQRNLTRLRVAESQSVLDAVEPPLTHCSVARLLCKAGQGAHAVKRASRSKVILHFQEGSDASRVDQNVLRDLLGQVEEVSSQGADQRPQTCSRASTVLGPSQSRSWNTTT